MKEQLTNQTRLPQQLNAISARLSEVDKVQRQCAGRFEEHERILELLSWVMVPLIQMKSRNFMNLPLNGYNTLITRQIRN